MVEVYVNGRPTGITYTGRRAYRLAMAAARDLSQVERRANYTARRVY